MSESNIHIAERFQGRSGLEIVGIIFLFLIIISIISIILSITYSYNYGIPEPFRNFVYKYKVPIVGQDADLQAMTVPLTIINSQKSPCNDEDTKQNTIHSSGEQLLNGLYSYESLNMNSKPNYIEESMSDKIDNLSNGNNSIYLH